MSGALVVIALAGCGKKDKEQAPAPSVKEPPGALAPVAQAPAAPAPAPAGATTVADDQLIVPGQRVGRITAATDRRTLDTLYPRGTVTHGMCDVGDEEESPCSHVAVGGKEALRVIWNDAIRADHVEVLTDAFQTLEGVKVGVTLPALVTINGGKPVAFAGFDWNGGGQVRVPAGPLAAAGLDMWLAPPEKADYDKVQKTLGDAEIMSSDPRAATFELHVARLEVALGATGAAAGGGCEVSGHYQLALTWGKKCPLDPGSLKSLGFNLTEGKGATFEAILDDGVMTPASSPYYDDISVEKVDGCKVTVKLAQPPSHQTWAFLTLELEQTGGKVTGNAGYDESQEGETCATKATVTGAVTYVGP